MVGIQGEQRNIGEVASVEDDGTSATIVLTAAHNVPDINVGDVISEVGSGVYFRGCSLAGAKFKHVEGIVIDGLTNLSGAVFEQGLPRINTLGGVNLSRVDLSNTRFAASFHFGINYIDFSGSNLSGVDFRNVSFSGPARVNLTDANLVNAKPFGFYRKLLGDWFDDPERKESRTVICRTRFSWGEESINCKPQN